MASHHFSISAQISEVGRELKMRRQVYPRQVSTGKLRQSVAEYQTEALAAVLELQLDLEPVGPRRKTAG